MCLAASPANGTLVSGARDTTARVWDPATQTCVGVLGGHSGWVRAVDCDMARLVTGSADGCVKVRTAVRHAGASVRQRPALAGGRCGTRACAQPPAPRRAALRR